LVVRRDGIKGPINPKKKKKKKTRSLNWNLKPDKSILLISPYTIKTISQKCGYTWFL